MKNGRARRWTIPLRLDEGKLGGQSAYLAGGGRLKVDLKRAMDFASRPDYKKNGSAGSGVVAANKTTTDADKNGFDSSEGDANPFPSASVVVSAA
jgi:hypothetical protein